MDVKKVKRAIKHPTRTSIYRKTNLTLGKKFFGNTNDLHFNLKGLPLQLKQTKKSSKFESDHYLFLDHPYDESLIKKIKKKYDEIIESEKYLTTREVDGRIFMRRIKEPEKHIPEISGLLTKEIIDILQTYYHGNFIVNRVEAGRNYEVPSEFENKEVFSNFWHCDNNPTFYTKLFVNLSNVTDDDGPFHCVSYQRTKQLIKMGFKDRNNPNLPNNVLYDENFLFKGTGTPGTSFLANTEKCLHRAGNPNLGHTRDVIVIRFEPSEKPISENWIENIKLDKDDLLKKSEELKKGIND